MKKLGRPTSNEPLRRQRNFSASDEELAEIDRLAKLERMNRSEFIRYKTLVSEHLKEGNK